MVLGVGLVPEVLLGGDDASLVSVRGVWSVHAALACLPRWYSLPRKHREVVLGVVRHGIRGDIGDLRGQYWSSKGL